MDLFDILTMVGGLCLFLFGMTIMGEALERRAGGALRGILGKLTTKKSAGFLTGLGVTAVIQSSSATTVMVVGFVNSGLIALGQAINVIMGANVGTTVTAWVLSLSGIEGNNIFVQLLKPTSFTPLLALIGVIYYMFIKDTKKKDTGLILLGFATLMFGMDTMSSAVSGLKNVPEFQNLFLMFTNPILGMLAGAVLTGIIQSSSASVGILQALAATGQVTYGAAIPIIMGQNIGTCVTALISSVGTTKDARRAALVHLSFNVIGTAVWLSVFSVIQAFFPPQILFEGANAFGIAVAHSIFNIACTVILLPMSGLLEKFVCKIVPDSKTPEAVTELDERLFATPAIALQSCRTVITDMAMCASEGINNGMRLLKEGFNDKIAENIKADEKQCDHYEDVLSSYLVKLSTLHLSESDSSEAAMLLKAIGDFERISDHSVNLLASAKELNEKDINFSENAKKELAVLMSAVSEIIDTSFKAFLNNDAALAKKVEPLEQVIDGIKEKLRTRHILRLQQGLCSIETGFIWSDLLTNLERTSDHCSNVAGSVIDFANHDMNIHETLHNVRHDESLFRDEYRAYAEKYAV
ncbi:MAG: Na/Pi cotransporter family protein [Ruminococcaceae bacterium]|nr:Na/Pi cotransporter family protein [Oscillospiraceae bacterium]